MNGYERLRIERSNDATALCIWRISDLLNVYKFFYIVRVKTYFSANRAYFRTRSERTLIGNSMAQSYYYFTYADFHHGK